MRTKANVAFRCEYHVVWCPKYRRRVIGGRMEVRLKEIIAEVTTEQGAWLIEMETMADHVGLLEEVDRRFGIHELVTPIKARSSRVPGEEFPWLTSKLSSLWTNSYFVARVGGAPLSVIKRCVEAQRDC